MNEPISNGNGADLKKTKRHRSSTAANSVDRLPPHSSEMERGVLGCILLSPNDCIGECIEKLKDNGKEAFYDLRHQTIYEALTAMFDAREAIDIITLQQRLKDKGMLEPIGGIPYLSQLQDSVPSAANLSYYLDSVREKLLLRRMIQTCTGAVSKIYEYEGEVDALLDEVERDVLKIAESRAGGQTVTIRDLVKKAITTIEDMHTRQGALTGIGTGFVDLDRMTSGLHGGEMIVIAARPSVGKTSLALNIAENVAVDQKLPVGIFSLEMTAESLVLRMMCSRSRIDMQTIRNGFLSDHHFVGLTTVAGQISGAPLYIDDTSGLSILQLRARARRMAQQYGIKLFVIDYLQQMNSSARKIDNRQQEIADISSGVKALAKELKVPVIVLSQLNRDFERDKTRKPNLADLRESGAIEQDADLVGILYKGDPDDPNKRKDDITDEETGVVPDQIPVNLLIAKQRNGPVGEVPLMFLRTLTRFEARSKFSAEDTPG